MTRLLESILRPHRPVAREKSTEESTRGVTWAQESQIQHVFAGINIMFSYSGP